MYVYFIGVTFDVHFVYSRGHGGHAVYIVTRGSHQIDFIDLGICNVGKCQLHRGRCFVVSHIEFPRLVFEHIEDVAFVVNIFFVLDVQLVKCVFECTGFLENFVSIVVVHEPIEISMYLFAVII